MESVRLKTVAGLASWLDHYHEKSGSTWLVYPKPTSGLGDLTYSTMVDVLLCYGWIDSLPRKVDAKWTSIRISPRNPKSNWSSVNKKKISFLQKAGRLKPAGKRMVVLAKQSGRWDALNDVDNLVLPPDLLKVLRPRVLRESFEAKSRSWRRGMLEQLLNAKQPATRAKRIATIVEHLTGG